MRLRTGGLISLVFFGTVLAFIAFIAVPELLIARNRSREKRTMVDMRSLALALEARATDVNSYDLGLGPPGTRVGSTFERFDALRRVSHEQLQRALVPKYIKSVPRKDAWGVDFDVRVGAYDKDGRPALYAIRSFGSDRRADGPVYRLGRKTKFSEDIVFSEGNFVRYPEGI